MIRYIFCFTFRCLKQINLKQNTHINKPKTTHNKPFNKNPSNPISNKNLESYGQKNKIFKKTTSVL